jgi:hypothetical protein
MMGDFTVTGIVQIRPVDLYVTKGYRGGVVLVGDAFRHPVRRHRRPQVLVDVERLQRPHPVLACVAWHGRSQDFRLLRSIKRACDRLSEKKAFRLRSYSIDTAPHWIALRFAKFVAHWGAACCGASTPCPRLPPAASATGSEQTSPWVRSTPAHK